MAAEKIALDVSEAAELLGISRPSLYRLMQRSDFPVFNIGSRRKISAAGLARWVEAQTNGGVDNGEA